MKCKYLKLGDFYWRADSRILFQKSLSNVNDYEERGLLTQKQFELLNCLLDASPTTLNKEQIIEKVWSTKHISAESLPQLIIRTRQALNDGNKEVLINEPGIGYRLNFTIEEQKQPEVMALSTCTFNGNNLSNEPETLIQKQNKLQQHCALVAFVALFGLMLFQVCSLSCAIHYKNVFENTASYSPYPYMSKVGSDTIIKVGNYECIYNKHQKLLRCK